jgi:hypothetical protein
VSQLAVVVELEKRVVLLSVVIGARVGSTCDSSWCGIPVRWVDAAECAAWAWLRCTVEWCLIESSTTLYFCVHFQSFWWVVFFVKLHCVSYTLTYFMPWSLFMDVFASQSKRIHDIVSFRLLPFIGNRNRRRKLICVGLWRQKS